MYGKSSFYIFVFFNIEQYSKRGTPLNWERYGAGIWSVVFVTRQDGNFLYTTAAIAEEAVFWNMQNLLHMNCKEIKIYELKMYKNMQ